MSVKRPYIIDSDVFITAKNGYYAFDICPGFWDSIIHHYSEGNISSIDRIRNELLAGRDTEDLVQWVKKKLPTGFFQSTGDNNVSSAFTEVMLWVQRNTQYYEQAKAKFATEADGWLVAFAMVHDAIIVTNEQPRPEAKNRVALPDVCEQFKVTYRNTFFMLKNLSIWFEWTGKS
ncbi:MAG: DUF4411 family protein [Verrucomicrobia bacterium]|nr:DUF4411 family protein [Verrucomicrobiota bacterium]MCF7707383.1 DUF4411 family protein [Verrucomicrobiota bacterium]